MTRLAWMALVLLGACGRGEPAPDPVLLAAPAGSVPRGAAASRAILEVGPADTRGGADAYRTFCAPCHGAGGEGDGPVIERGFTRPQAFAALPPSATRPERVVAIIGEGYGAMRPLGHQIPPADRWAIARHVESIDRD